MSATLRRLAPFAVLVPVLAAVLFFALPLIGLVLRVPWSELGTRLLSDPIVDALRLSLLCSTGAAILSCGIGLPLAIWLAKRDSVTRSIVRVLVALPMVLPPVVGGVALLLAYGRRGVVGAWFDSWFGISLPFTTTGVIVAATYVAMPFFVLSAEAGLRSFDRRYEGVAATLGANPWQRLWRVTLPMIAPSLGTGLVIAWARALGEFGATITFAGNLRGQTRTMPLEVYVALETDPEAAIVLSLVLVVLASVLLFALRERWFPTR